MTAAGKAAVCDHNITGLVACVVWQLEPETRSVPPTCPRYTMHPLQLSMQKKQHDINDMMPL